MNKRQKLPKIGLRSIKTAISATLCALLYMFFDRNATFACIGAVFGMESDTSEKPWLTGVNRLLGTVIGGFLGMGLFCLSHTMNNNVFDLLFLLVGIILLIYLSQLLRCPGAIQGGAVVFYIIMLNTPDTQYISYALNRMLDTAIGVAMSVLINVCQLKLAQRKNPQKENLV